jgi:hypothetical protein
MPKFLESLAIIGLLVGLASAPSPARAQNSATWFLEKIDSGDAIALVVLKAYAHGLDVANADLEFNGLNPLYCAPRYLTITPEQNADIFRRFVNGEGAIIKDMPAGLVMLEALKATFPCEASQDR